ncbi:hypothetical protein Mgra_00006466 [Meloidogyne graminicola]|uniref:Uncharacterized protein n=1 Tax=Meloidogyne graminicola TaxID=189291 RepID=A0A8S9ZLW1_9BILA|nr:hypothetical protein Mgra_00006466 [Meloidogyne graminicola]
MERLEDEQTDNSENMVIIGKNSVKYIANGSTNK